jgi:hypothetical protein
MQTYSLAKAAGFLNSLPDANRAPIPELLLLTRLGDISAV